MGIEVGQPCLKERTLKNSADCRTVLPVGATEAKAFEVTTRTNLNEGSREERIYGRPEPLLLQIYDPI